MSFKLTYSTMFDPPPQLHARFEEAMARQMKALGARHDLYVGGAERRTPERVAGRNPADQSELLGEFPVATAEDVNAALEAAHAAFKLWKQTPWSRRLELLRRVGGLIEERVYDIAAALTLEVGKNRMEALGEAQESAEFFYTYCDDFERHEGYDRALPDDPIANYASHNRSVLKPYGAWVVINPFNFPLALAAGPVAAALATGNTVVLKCASATPWAGRLLADCIRDAGLPAGTFNYLNGDASRIGAALIAHPLTAGVTFTGSHAAGRQIAQQLQASAVPRPYIAELGGKNACIVTSAADLDRAATGIVRSAFGMGGQKCSALSRLYVDAKVADALLDRIGAQTAALCIGNPARRENWLGPVTTRAAFENYARYREQLSGPACTVRVPGGTLTDGELARGFYVRPMLAEAPLEHPLWQTEMFLPILMLHRVHSKEEAMQLANRSPLGLTAGFYGAPEEIAWFHAEIEAGVTYANRPQGATTGAWPGYQPFGGWKGSGSTGKGIASFYYLPQYLREQAQTVVE